MWRYIIDQKEKKWYYGLPTKNRFKKLVLFKKNIVFDYKIIYLQKKYCRMYANTYIFRI